MKVALIVEGLKDKEQIIKAFENTDYIDNIKILVTEGTKFNNRIMAEIENYHRDGFNIYVLSDPDTGGNHLANMIRYWYPEIPRLEADTSECAYFTGKKFKMGIEYASYDYLKEIISPLIGRNFKRKQCPINWD